MLADIVLRKEVLVLQALPRPDPLEIQVVWEDHLAVVAQDLFQHPAVDQDPLGVEVAAVPREVAEAAPAGDKQILRSVLQVN